MNALAFISGMIIGGSCGLLVSSMMSVASAADDRDERMEHYERPGVPPDCDHCTRGDLVKGSVYYCYFNMAVTATDAEHPRGNNCPYDQWRQP